MDKYRKRRAQLVAAEMVEKLKEKGYETYYAEDVEEARQIALSLIPEGASVGVGGSETLNAMNLIEELRNGPYHFFDRYQKLPFSEIEEIYRQALNADVFVSSCNAVTRDGRLVNMDSSGNRVAAISYGPRKVILAVGANKVVNNLDEAMDRIYHIAPLNAMRVKHKAPCVETGKCEGCQIHASVCNSIGIINHGHKTVGRFHIIMIAEEVGF
ncbi:MAG: lactate utilization protein [Erysipelotrichaceae bacterium]|nr:lactate utilization protein [Erysipelotrichaceae bacterium]